MSSFFGQKLNFNHHIKQKLGPCERYVATKKNGYKQTEIYYLNSVILSPFNYILHSINPRYPFHFSTFLSCFDFFSFIFSLIHPFIPPFTHPSIYPSSLPSIHSSINPTILPSINPSIVRFLFCLRKGECVSAICKISCLAIA